MIKWEALASPKEFGGLGFIDTRAMNTALLAKWIFKLDRGENSMAIEVLRKKYLGDKSFCQTNKRGCSQFWHAVWLDGCPLKLRFPRLFRICRQQDWSVADFKEVSWELDLRRRVGIEEVAE